MEQGGGGKEGEGGFFQEVPPTDSDLLKDPKIHPISRKSHTLSINSKPEGAGLSCYKFLFTRDVYSNTHRPNINKSNSRCSNDLLLWTQTLFFPKHLIQRKERLPLADVQNKISNHKNKIDQML